MKYEDKKKILLEIISELKKEILLEKSKNSGGDVKGLERANDIILGMLLNSIRHSSKFN